MQLTNPFPGMNPFLEGSWSDVHVGLIVGIADALHQVLPENFAPRPDEEERLPEACDDFVTMELPPRRWVKILDIDDGVITAIEVLCPSDKHGKERPLYLQRQQDWLRAGVNLVEIDLLRVGEPACSPELATTQMPAEGTRYLITVTRAHRPAEREIYYCPLRDPLPVIRVPLRRSDPDVPLALQPLIDRVYRTGRYWQVSRSEVPAPALPTDDAVWVEERLHLAGLK